MQNKTITPTRCNSNILSFKTCSNIFADRTLLSLMFALYSPTCCISYRATLDKRHTGWAPSKDSNSQFVRR